MKINNNEKLEEKMRRIINLENQEEQRKRRKGEKKITKERE